jgi:hypothetical protein
MSGEWLQYFTGMFFAFIFKDTTMHERGAHMKMNTMEDWEKWVELAREDPEKFERERSAAIEKLIMSQSARHRHRSRQLQWKIDAVRKTSPTALYSCIRIYDMLMDSVYGPKGLLESIGLLYKSDAEPAWPEVTVRKKGRLVDFRRTKKEKSSSENHQ